MHLIGEHSLIMSNNVFGVAVTGGIIGIKMGLVTSLFNHSCSANIFNGLNGDTDVFLTIRPIKKGEQLFVKYKLGDVTTQLRQAMLWQKFNFHCKCDICDNCEPHCPEADRTAMYSHPDFRFLCAAQIDTPGLKEKCIAFLRAFDHQPWSEQIDVALKIYTEILFNEYFKKY